MNRPLAQAIIRYLSFSEGFAESQAVFAAAINYSYDSAGRLIKADYGAAGSISYTYDKAGNLLSRVVSTTPSATAPAIP